MSSPSASAPPLREIQLSYPESQSQSQSQSPPEHQSQPQPQPQLQLQSQSQPQSQSQSQTSPPSRQPYQHAHSHSSPANLTHPDAIQRASHHASNSSAETSSNAPYQMSKRSRQFWQGRDRDLPPRNQENGGRLGPGGDQYHRHQYHDSAPTITSFKRDSIENLKKAERVTKTKSSTLFSHDASATPSPVPVAAPAPPMPEYARPTMPAMTRTRGGSLTTDPPNASDFSRLAGTAAAAAAAAAYRRTTATALPAQQCRAQQQGQHQQHARAVHAQA
ncbi:hypothetical protein KEM52_005751 [Ascosphaera acerosa]|nr:hypothetical protein KEM52_005751 [Ascosphaera acerosa]